MSFKLNWENVQAMLSPIEITKWIRNMPIEYLEDFSCTEFHLMNEPLVDLLDIVEEDKTIGVDLKVIWNTQTNILLSFNLVYKYNSEPFVRFPVSLSIRQIIVEALIHILNSEKLKVSVSEYSFSFEIDSCLGKSLINLDKLKPFVSEVLTELIESRLVLPNFVEISKNILQE